MRALRLLGRPAVWLSLLFIASRAVVFLFLAGRGTDLGVHAGYWSRILGGQVPFRDFVPEYPPLVFAFTGIPALLDPSLHWYFPIFRGLCCAFDCGIWVLLLGLTRARPTRPLLYLFGTTALGPLIYDRVDIVLGLLLLSAMAAMLGGRDGPFSLEVGTGIAFKLIPITWGPIVLAAAWKRGMRRLILAALLLAAPTLVSFDLMAALGGYRFGQLFTYHIERGVQIESTAASVEMVLMRCGTPGTVSFEFGSVNFHTRYEVALIHGATLLFALTLIIATWMAARRRMSAESMSLLLAGVLSSALLFSKVLSPQYFLFLLPVLAVLPVPRSVPAAVANWLLVAAIFALQGSFIHGSTMP